MAYPFGLSIKNYIAHLREIAAGRATSSESGLNLPDESARLKAAQREHYELKNALIRHGVIRIEDVQPAWARIVLAVRSAMLAIPNSLRLKMPHLTVADIEQIRKIIRDALRAAALTDTPPAIEISDDAAE